MRFGTICKIYKTVKKYVTLFQSQFDTEVLMIFPENAKKRFFSFKAMLTFCKIFCTGPHTSMSRYFIFEHSLKLRWYRTQNLFRIKKLRDYWTVWTTNFVTHNSVTLLTEPLMTNPSSNLYLQMAYKLLILTYACRKKSNAHIYIIRIVESWYLSLYNEHAKSTLPREIYSFHISQIAYEIDS